MAIHIFMVLAIFGITASSQSVSYEGYHVFRMTPHSVDQVEFLKSLDPTVNFWKDCSVPERVCDVLLSPKQQGSLLPEIETLGITVDKFVDDVGSLAKIENREQVGRIAWDDYYGVDDIHAFLNEQASSHSSIANVINIGPSFEERNLNVIKIAKNSTRKPVIFVEANAHAREWITNAVTTYLVNELLNSEDTDIQEWTNDFDWYVLPVFNPDGLEYTRSTDRLWRKNRSNSTTPPYCRGVDLNRNFDYNWCGVGSSINPCSDTYCGSAPNSEPETRALTTFIQENLKDDLVLYLSVHSYSQFIMFPFGDTVDTSFYDYNMRIATEAANAAQVRYGTVFSPGNWLQILYPSTGDSMDWVKSKLMSSSPSSLSFTYELRDTGRYGFLLPKEQILPSAEEFVDSLKPIIDALRTGISA